jgi:hypothetical protein
MGVLTVSALLSVGLCWSFIANARELRSLQAQATQINNSRAMVQALANETLEYSKTHPAIDPILESVGLKPGKAGSVPATKPATK